MLYLSQTPTLTDAIESLLVVCTKVYFGFSFYTAQWRWNGDSDSFTYLPEKTPAGEATTKLHVAREFPSIASISEGQSIFPCVVIKCGKPEVRPFGFGGLGPRKASDGVGNTAVFGETLNMDVNLLAAALGDAGRRDVDAIAGLIHWGLITPEQKDAYSILAKSKLFGLFFDRYKPKPGETLGDKYFGKDRLWRNETHIPLSYDFSESIYVTAYGVILVDGSTRYWYSPGFNDTAKALVWQDEWVEVTDDETLARLRALYEEGKRDGQLGVANVEQLQIDTLHTSTILTA